MADLANVNLIELGSHSLTFAIVAFLLKQYRMYIQMKDRMDTLYQEYCEVKDIPFKPLGE